MTVTVQSALSEVQASARRLRDLVRELVLTAVEDQPRNCQVHLVTVIHDAALEASAEAEQADACMGLAWTTSGATHEGTSAVVRCQRHVILLGQVLVRQVAAPEFIDDLNALGRERGREVRTWAAEIVRCIQACQQILWTDLLPAILAYWEEIADMNSDARSAPRSDCAGRTSDNA